MSREPIEFGIAPPSPEPSPKAKPWRWVLLAIVVLLAVSPFAVGVYVMNQLRHLATPVEGMVRNEVTFEVTGTGTAASITATAGTTVQTESNVTLPWTRTIYPPDGELSVRLVVVAGPEGAEVHGKYTVNGASVRESTASGPGAVLTITGS